MRNGVPPPPRRLARACLRRCDQTRHGTRQRSREPSSPAPAPGLRGVLARSPCGSQDRCPSRGRPRWARLAHGPARAPVDLAVTCEPASPGLPGHTEVGSLARFYRRGRRQFKWKTLGGKLIFKQFYENNFMYNIKYNIFRH